MDTDNVVNLSKQNLRVEQLEVLAMGLGFCPERNHNLFDTVKDVNLFVRKLMLKVLHHKNIQSPVGVGALMQLSLTECRELRDLLLMDSQEAPSTRPLCWRL